MRMSRSQNAPNTKGFSFFFLFRGHMIEIDLSFQHTYVENLHKMMVLEGWDFTGN